MAIAAKKYEKVNIKIFLSCLILMEFFTLFQIFCPRLRVLRNGSSMINEWALLIIIRSSRPVAKFIGKHLCQSLFFNKIADARVFLWILRNFLRTPFYIELLWWLLLYIIRPQFSCSISDNVKIMTLLTNYKTPSIQFSK